MRCLITGAGGLIGPFLADHLLASEAEVWATYHSSLENLERLRERCILRQLDIGSAEAVDHLIRDCKPETVFHLAAQSFPSKSWTSPEETIRANVIGTLCLLDAVRRYLPKGRVVALGSSAEYGSAGSDGVPLSEDSPLEPDSPYGVSKVGANLLCDVYAKAYGMDVVRVRPFFVIGPARATNVFTYFAQKIVDVETGAADPIGVGNLQSVRDFVDVRDAVRAICLMAEKGASGAVYNLCSGTGHSIAEGLELMCGFAKNPVRTYVDKSRFRPLDTPRLVGDNHRLRQLGWSPEISFDRTLLDILNFWRRQPRHVASGSTLH